MADVYKGNLKTVMVADSKTGELKPVEVKTPAPKKTAEKKDS